MESYCAWHFSNLLGFRGNNTKLIITCGNKLLAVQCPSQKIYFFIQTEAVIKFEPFDIEYFNIKGIGDRKDTTLFVASKLSWCINLKFLTFKSFYICTHKLFLSKWENIFKVIRNVDKIDSLVMGYNFEWLN